MRKIGMIEIMLGMVYYSIVIASSIAVACYSYYNILPEKFVGIGTLLIGIISYFLVGLAIHAFYIRLFPLPTGKIEKGSWHEIKYHVYILQHLFLIHLLQRTYLLPMPITKLLYIVLGAKLGENSFTAGIICDASMVEVGKHSLFGTNSLIVPHLIAGERLEHFPISIGNHVTVGANTMILPGCKIGNHSVIAPNSVLRPHTQVGTNELWSGNPARFVRKLDRPEDHCSSPMANMTLIREAKSCQQFLK